MQARLCNRLLRPCVAGSPILRTPTSASWMLGPVRRCELLVGRREPAVKYLLRDVFHFRSYQQLWRGLARSTPEYERESLVTTFYPCRHAMPYSRCCMRRRGQDEPDSDEAPLSSPFRSSSGRSSLTGARFSESSAASSPDCSWKRTAPRIRAPGPGFILFVQTFGDLVNFNPHVHALVADASSKHRDVSSHCRRSRKRSLPSVSAAR